MELTYGQINPNQADFESNFAPVGNWELKMGRSELNKFSETNASLNEWYLFFSYMNSNSSLSNIDTNEVSTEFFKFGISKAEGLGYYGPHLSFIPYVSQSLMWTKLNSYSYSHNSSQSELSTNDQDIISRYLDSFRFGDRVLYGFKSDILSSLQIVVNYETGVIYPRHLFFK
mgnify:FL=1